MEVGGRPIRSVIGIVTARDRSHWFRRPRAVGAE